MARWDGYVKTQKPCSNENCTNLVWKGKYCGKCKQRLSRHGNTETVLSKHRTYFFNEKLLDNWTKESAWIIGWIITDGCITIKISPNVTLELKDKEPLEIIKTLFQYNGEIHQTTKKEKEYWQLRLHSIYLVNKLGELGIGPAKSLTIKCPDNIPQEFVSHFIRGVIEGDGSVGRYSGTLRIHINSASKEFIDGLAKLIPFNGCKFEQTKNRVNPLWRLAYSGKQAEQLAQWLYKDSEGLRLIRKYEVTVSAI